MSWRLFLEYLLVNLLVLPRFIIKDSVDFCFQLYLFFSTAPFHTKVNLMKVASIFVPTNIFLQCFFYFTARVYFRNENINQYFYHHSWKKSSCASSSSSFLLLDKIIYLQPDNHFIFKSYWVMSNYILKININWRIKVKI